MKHHTFNIKALGEPVVSMEISEEKPLPEMIEAFEAFLYAVGYRLPNGARIGYEWDEQETRLAPAPEEPVIQDSRITEPVDDWKCPHCGSTTGTWFSRVEPMGDICEDCGKAVDEEPFTKELVLGAVIEDLNMCKTAYAIEYLRDEIQKLKQK